MTEVAMVAVWFMHPEKTSMANASAMELVAIVVAPAPMSAEIHSQKLLMQFAQIVMPASTRSPKEEPAVMLAMSARQQLFPWRVASSAAAPKGLLSLVTGPA